MKKLLIGVLVALTGVAPMTASAQTPACDGTFHAWHAIEGDTVLFDLDMLGPNDGYAVGQNIPASGRRAEPLVVHFDDADYQTTIPPYELSTDLSAVEAITPNDIYAVGGTVSRHQKLVIYNYDGTQWSLMDVPQPGPNSHLDAVAATSPNDVWAGGYYETASGEYDILLMHYDGAWTQSYVPSPGKYAGLYGLTAVSPNDVWAVGFKKGISRPYALHWDGTSWTPIRFPRSIRSHDGTFYAMVEISPTEQWFVGNAYSKHPLAVHRVDGHSVLTDVPNVRGEEAFFDATAVGSEVWAVGWRIDQVTHPRAAHWDGSAWTNAVVEGAAPNGTMEGVDTDGTGAVWALSKIFASVSDEDDVIEKECMP
ncbi:MAG TPA: hypothetical protein VFK89_12575 [Actinomycetota bacterium]|nr:hypothetical protein [Actinomycetota bacterium]